MKCVHNSITNTHMRLALKFKYKQHHWNITMDLYSRMYRFKLIYIYIL